MIDGANWSPEEQMVMEEYGYRCVLCVFQFAVTLHHEPPRSLNPSWKDEPWTQFPLCNAHHEMVTGMPREDAEFMIHHHLDMYFPKAIERIKEKLYAAQSSST